MGAPMLTTVEDRRAVSAEVTVEMVEAYLKSRWTPATSRKGGAFSRNGAVVQVLTTDRPVTLACTVELIAKTESRQPSAVLSDIVGYQVGLDCGRASVLRNSASARVVEAREVLAKVKPHDATGRERARVWLAQAEAELAAATRALEAATT